MVVLRDRMESYLNARRSSTSKPATNISILNVYERERLVLRTPAYSKCLWSKLTSHRGSKMRRRTILSKHCAHLCVLDGHASRSGASVPITAANGRSSIHVSMSSQCEFKSVQLCPRLIYNPCSIPSVHGRKLSGTTRQPWRA